jgi:hypothetical protein
MTSMMSSFDRVPGTIDFIATDAAVELHAAHGRQVVALSE